MQKTQTYSANKQHIAVDNYVDSTVNDKLTQSFGWKLVGTYMGS